MKLFALCALVALPSLAAPVCRQIDVPGSSYTQGWQVSNAGALALNADQGAFVYKAGSFQILPAPDPSTGYAQSGLAALAVNDSGLVGGSASADGVTFQAFLYDGSNFTFLDSPAADYPYSQVRDVNGAGVATVGLDALGDDGSVASGVGYLYDHGAWSPLNPTLDGETPWLVIPGQINDAGTVVGAAWFTRFGGAHAPGVYGFVTSGGSTSIFRVSSGTRTRARGINNHGVIVGTYLLDDGVNWGGFIQDASGEHVFGCPGAASVYPESINDDGTIGGMTVDLDGNFHGLLRYPTVGAALNDLEAQVTGVAPGGSLEAKIDVVQKDYAAGKTLAACGMLKAFDAEVAATQPADAASYTAQADAIAAALGCK